MNKKIVTILIALLLVCAMVFTFVACAEKNTETPAGDETSADNGSGEGAADGTKTENGQAGSDATVEQEAKYSIFYYTGETATQVETQTGIKAGDTIAAPEDPRLAYNEFDGWYTDYGTFENKFVFDKMPANNVCLYANWIKTVSDDELGEVEKALAETSSEGHLYIHYRRFDNTAASYEPLNLWVWPYGYTGRTFDWDRDASGNVIVSTVGATCDVDLTVVYNDAGKTEDKELTFLKNAGSYVAGSIKDADNYMDPRFGFLIVYKASKGITGSHWQSDGNADQLFNVSEAVWDNGSLHIFCVQDNVSDYTFHISDDQEPIVNPYENDNGTNVSIANVNSSETIKINSEYATVLGSAGVSGVGYQIMVSSFADSDGDGIGDIQGIIDKFDYLLSLHIDTLWLTPIQLSDSYHGYDIIDYKQVDPKFGTLEQYQHLIELCHANGIKIIMDLVLNHTSTNNVWFQRSAKLDPEYRSFYQWRNHTVETNLSSDWYKYSEYDYSYYGKFSPSMPELNYDYQGTRDAIADVALYWLGILNYDKNGNLVGSGKGGVDGFRIDAVKHIYMADEVTPSSSDIIIRDYDDATQTDYSSNLTKNLNFFCWLVNAIKSQYPNAYLVGENFDGHAYNVAPYYEAYDGMLDFYMYYNFGKLSQYPTMASSLAGADSSDTNSQPKGDNTYKLKGGAWSYAGVLNTQADYSWDSTGSRNIMGGLFTSNHDIPRLVNNVVRDDLGNGAWRAGTVTSYNSDTAITYAKAVISAMMTMPGVSFIYYGDELGMSSNYLAGQNADSPHVDRQYRQPFKWTTKDYDEGGDPMITHYSISGDETYYVTWDAYNEQLAGVAEQTGNANSLLEVTRYWTEKKSTDDVLRYGSYQFEYAWGNESAQLFSFKRSYNGKTYWCLTNFGAQGNAHAAADVSSMLKTGTVKYYTPGGYSNGSLAGGATLVIELY